MGTPSNPEPHDMVTLIDAEGRERVFTVMLVDEEAVVCDSIGRIECFTRSEFEELFEEEES